MTLQWNTLREHESEGSHGHHCDTDVDIEAVAAGEVPAAKATGLIDKPNENAAHYTRQPDAADGSGVESRVASLEKRVEIRAKTQRLRIADQGGPRRRRQGHRRHEAAAAPAPAPARSEAHGSQSPRTGARCCIYSSMKSFYGDRLDIAAYKELLDGVLRDLGDPSDPMERMLAEQAVVAHHLVGRLQSKAANQEKADNAEVYLRGATKLMSEFRKHMELFTRLRTQSSGSPPAPVTPNQEDQPKNIGDTKLASKARKQVTRAA